MTAAAFHVKQAGARLPTRTDGGAQIATVQARCIAGSAIRREQGKAVCNPLRPFGIRPGFAGCTFKTCQFIAGEPGSPKCGRDALPGAPYCPEHRALCHVPGSALDDATREAAAEHLARRYGQ